MRISPFWNQVDRKKGSLPSLAILVCLMFNFALDAQPSANNTNTAASGGSAAPVFEEWEVIMLDHKQCGFDSTITTEDDTPVGKQFHTSITEEFVVNRDTAELKFTSISKITEDADGGVLSFNEETSGGGSDIVASGTRDGDDLVVTSRGQTARYHVPRLSALGPEAIRQKSLLVPLKPGQTFTFNTFDSDDPQEPVIIKGTVVGRETHDVRGTERPLWRMTTEQSVMPGLLTTEWVDDRSNDVESLVVMPGIGDLYEYVTDRAECMKQPEGAEIFSSTLVYPDKAIPAPKNLAKAVYRISCSDNTKPLALWNGKEQRVLSSRPGASEIEVTVPTYTPADATWRLPHADTPELHQFLQPTSYLEINSPEIQKLAREAVGNAKNPVKAAELIESFVEGYIDKKDLNIGFASAEETAKSREGDCTEHAVLCAAIGRAAGLPTRCVLGLGYIPPGVDEPTVSDQVDNQTGIFGFHMWAEAWIGPDEWVPMDAALNGFDVGHITIMKTALEEINPLIDLNAPILQLMQNLKIDVLKTEPKSNPASPAAPAPPESSKTNPATAPKTPEVD